MTTVKASFDLGQECVFIFYSTIKKANSPKMKRSWLNKKDIVTINT